MSKEIKEIYFIIPAAGVGSRMGADVPKQYLEIAGETILTHTLKLFLSVPEISGGVVALSTEDTTPLKVHNDRLWQVEGGETRTDSVAAGLTYLANRLQQAGKSLADVWVAVHDAARPGLTSAELSQFLQSVIQDFPAGGAIMALPAQDTIKLVDDANNITKTLNRDQIWLAQTPQMAPLKLLLEATRKIMQDGANVTDEASVLEYNGYFPKIYRGYHHNFKITYPEDLRLMSLYFSEREKCE
ncbi:MAG TPA: 2-C-methyl-D-erythritol 4-phosphate cytidylyltransferase [Candidatus Ignatzschineria merdigallinarum]|uniref:2-C-methyl-D-erythritol 4-phosphate cytidylyltransferase n=1 Tax=Candidatus Ignatzschineria merdigallinarum TaxID=2838621 RepID=A0A9D1Q743_9GAMM|nr:2-C-methyl-D-erythritol 4-phosphate cytidylyltransferase [Candidatus Ignatzschineria merdigallinarum]